MIQLVCTDFDRTIHDGFSSPPIPRDFLELMLSAQKRGVCWMINTGRVLSSVLEALEEAKLPIQPDFIVSVERFVHARRDHGYEDHAAWNSICESDHQLLFEDAKELLSKIRREIESEFSMQLYEDPWSPLCITAFSSSDADQIHSRILAHCENLPSLSVVRNDVYFRFAHSRYTKGTALGEVARFLKLDRTEIFAAGDHFNDIPMLDGTHAAWVAAPANAILEVKKVVSQAKGYLAHQPFGLGTCEALQFFERQLALESSKGGGLGC
jgi:hydroxymethylpyrimidine pyrophosphatase-like HAD family hydrolase